MRFDGSCNRHNADVFTSEFQSGLEPGTKREAVTHLRVRDLDRLDVEHDTHGLAHHLDT